MAYDPFAPDPALTPPPAPLADANALAPMVDPAIMTATAAPTDTAHPLSFVGPNGHITDMAGFHAALQSWRGDKPQFSYDPTADASRQAQTADWRTAKMDWRDQRPDKHTWDSGVGMVPGVPGSVGTNPNGNPGIVPPSVAALAGWRGPRARGV